MSTNFTLKITSAVALGGQIFTPSRDPARPTLVEVDEATAKSLLHRGKAVVFGEEPASAETGETVESQAEDAEPKGEASKKGGRKGANKTTEEDEKQ